MEFSATVSFSNPPMTGKADKDGYNGDWSLRESFKIYDIVRINAFVASRILLEIPAGSDTAAPGEWVAIPYKLFAAVKEELGEPNIIAEDSCSWQTKWSGIAWTYRLPEWSISSLGWPEDERIDSLHLALSTSTWTHDNNIVLTGTVTRSMMRLVAVTARHTNRKEYETAPRYASRQFIS